MTKQQLSSGTSVEIRRPSGTASRGVVVLPDVGGLGPNFDRIADDLAERCDAAVGVVELFPGKEHLSFQERLAGALGELSEEALLGDAVETAGLLEVEPVAILGVCIGGAMAMRAATTGRFDRVVSLYGMVHLPPQWAAHKGDPLAGAETAVAAAVPVLAIGGTDDQFVSTADLDELERAGAWVIKVPGAKHGFAHDPDLPSHDAAAAADAWSEIAGFLGRVPTS